MTDEWVIVVTGPTCSGKSSVARSASSATGWELLHVRQHLLKLLPNRAPTRRDLQDVGAEIEHSTRGTWLRTMVEETMERSNAGSIIVDSARTGAQVDSLRSRYPDACVVHVTASVEVREFRFAAARRRSELIEPQSFEDVVAHSVESEAEQLSLVADCVLDTSLLVKPAAAQEFLRLLMKHDETRGES